MNDKVEFSENVVAGGPDNYIEVHHVLLKGSNYVIGRKIAEIAKTLNVRINPEEDTIRNRMKREYIRRNYPIFYKRMKGIADAFGEELDNDCFDFSGIVQYPVHGVSCSVLFYPGSVTENGHSIMSRNFDFTTGTAQGTIPKEGEMALMERPYIFEMYPDEGYASLSICAYDLLGGVLDGINSEGLVVSILGDEETMAKYGMQPSNGVGVHELLSMRYLLDNCKNTVEAKEALLYLKHYYGFVPCHYIVADEQGSSFVFEFSSLRNSVHIIDGEGIQCVTNHLLHNYGSIDDFPEGESIETNSYRRYEKLHKLTKKKNAFGISEIKKINEAVANEGLPYDNPDYAPNRTLWHALYDIEERSLSVKFYLGEKESKKGEKEIEYSEYKKFVLKSTV